MITFHCTACKIDYITLHLHYKITKQFFVAYIRKTAAVKGENSMILSILMAPTNKGNGASKCREVTCSKTITLIQSHSKHEKKFQWLEDHWPRFHNIILIQKDIIAQCAVAKAPKNTNEVSPGISKKEAHWIEKKQ